MGNIAMIGLMGIGGSIPVPAGLIILFNDTTIPDGWERFTSADDKHIVGAGSTYSVGNTGGVDYTPVMATAGSHTGSAGSGLYTGDYMLEYKYPMASGSHAHEITGGNYKNAYNQVLLIKANESSLSFPAKGILLSSTNLAGDGLTNVLTTKGLLKSGNSITTGGGSTAGMGIGTAGSHAHAYTNPKSGYVASMLYLKSWYGFNMLHDTDHNFSISLTPNVKRKILSAWSNASAEFDSKTDMIALWESSEPPLGWAICNGSGGTYDFRDYFIEIDETGNESTTGTGNNTISGSITAGTFSWTHYHGQYQMCASNSGYHPNESHSHNHDRTITAESYTPPYYALYFVQKL